MSKTTSPGPSGTTPAATANRAEPSGLLVPRRQEPAGALILQARSGPLPPPAELAAYAATPGAIEFILRQTTREQEHRHALQRGAQRDAAADVQAGRRQVARGQWMGFLLCVLSLASGALIALMATSWQGQVAGAFVSFAGMGSLVYVFMSGNRPARRGELAAGDGSPRAGPTRE